MTDVARFGGRARSHGLAVGRIVKRRPKSLVLCTGLFFVRV
jgi:hypothetical protein